MSSQSAGTFGPLVERLILRYRKGMAVMIQLALVVASFIFSFVLRLDLDPGQVPWGLVLKTLPLLIALRLVALWMFQLYQGLWRYVSVLDLLQIIKATTVSSVLFTVLQTFIFGLDEFPRSVFLLDWAGNLFVLGGIRVFVRLVRERFRPMRSRKGGDGTFKRLLIIGAGDAGAALCKQALSSPSFRYYPVAFVDDDTSRIGDSIQGVPIVGRCRDIAWVVDEYQVGLAVIAIPSATPAQRGDVVEICQRVGVAFKVLPGTPDIIEGTVSISHIREVEPADLLGRPPARLDWAAIDGFIRGKRLLVTGAAGSVGSELSRQLARHNPELLLLVDQAENPLFFLESEVRSTFPDTSLAAQIADVTDRVMMRHLIKEYRPHIVLHAAAHKHVPLMERVPAQAVKNNVGGTHVLAVCAQECGVERFVLVSTDKAVKPTSVMGTTKRLGEMLIQDLDRQGPTRFIAVRFGNVLGSDASVVPIFKQQIANGGPVTVTHPDATRYFMSIPEAAGLIVQAGAVGSGGEIVVLDMGDPVRIVDLAKTIISLSGFKSYEDIDIVFTSLRPGEKLHEELHGEEEEFLPTEYDKLFVLKNHHPIRGVRAEVEEFLRLLPTMDADAVKAYLKQLVPEYQPSSTITDRVGYPDTRTG